MISGNQEQELRQQIERYWRIHSINRDPKVRKGLEDLIREVEAKLDGIRSDRPGGE